MASGTYIFSTSDQDQWQRQQLDILESWQCLPPGGNQNDNGRIFAFGVQTTFISMQLTFIVLQVWYHSWIGRWIQDYQSAVNSAGFYFLMIYRFDFSSSLSNFTFTLEEPNSHKMFYDLLFWFCIRTSPLSNNVTQVSPLRWSPTHTGCLAQSWRESFWLPSLFSCFWIWKKYGNKLPLKFKMSLFDAMRN